MVVFVKSNLQVSMRSNIESDEKLARSSEEWVQLRRETTGETLEFMHRRCEARLLNLREVLVIKLY